MREPSLEKLGHDPDYLGEILEFFGFEPGFFI
jgi:hypothetical protein